MKGASLRCGPQGFFKKLNTTIKEPVNLSRRSNLVVKTEALSVLPAGRTDPSVVAATVPVRVALRQANQVFFGLAFFPPHTVRSDYKEVRRVEDAKTFPIRRTIVELNRGSLVVILDTSSSCSS